MKRLYRHIGIIVVAWLIGSCHGGEGVVGPPPAPKTGFVSVSQDTATLVPAGTLQLSAEAKNASGEALQRTFSWTTSDPSKAAVSNSGLVVGVDVGTATITATADGKSATARITVLDGGVVSSTGGTLTLQSGSVHLVVPADAVASKANLWITASSPFLGDPDAVMGSAFDFGPPGTTFARPVTVTIRYNPSTLPPGTEEQALELYVNSGSGWEVVPQSVVDLTAKTVSAPISHFSTYAIRRPAAVAGIEIGGASPLTVGQSEQLTATVTAANGRVLNRTVAWSSSDPAVASINQTGLVTGLKAGGVTISASAGGKTSSVVITVNPVGPVAVASVALSAPTTPMVVGASQVLTAAPKDAGGATLSGRTVTWVSSNNAVLALSGTSSVSIGSGATMTVTAVGVGTATITATSETIGATTPLITVNPAPPAPVNTVTVTPTSASLGIGATQQLVATLRDAAGNVLTGRTITWASESPTVASVNATGLVTAIGMGGPIEILATSEGKEGASSITVTSAPPPVVTVGLSSPTTPMVVGATQVLTATPRDGGGSVLSGRTVNWVSSNTAVLTVSAASSVSTSSGATVTVTAAGPGTATITATSEAAPTATTPVITVNAVPPAPVNTVTVSPASGSLQVGATQQLVATLRDAAGNVLTGRAITWASESPTVASVSASGLVTATGVGGPIEILATSEGKEGASSITVTALPPPPVNTVTLNPPSASIVVGATQALVATLRDAAGNVLTGRSIIWSSNSAAATVDATGLVTGVSVGGPVTITATSEGRSGTSSITVTAVPVATVTLSGATTPMVVGATQQLTAQTLDANGNVLTGRFVTWGSSNNSVLTVSASGLVTAAGAGTATITATSEAASATTPVITVNPVPPPPVNAVTVAPPSATLQVGATQQLVATLTDVGGNTLTGRAIAWTSGASGVASVDANGLVTAVSVGGPVTITATSEGRSGTSSITVRPVPVAAVTLSAPTTPMTVGATQVLTATPRDGGGSALSGRTVNWVSSNTAVLTVSAATSVSSSSGATVTVTAAGVGTATITATSETIGATTPAITVNAVPPAPVNTVTVSPTPVSLQIGATQQLVATLRDAAGNVLTGRTITWASESPTVASVNATGLVTATGVGGPIEIVATSEGKAGASSVTVTNAPPPPVVTVGLSTPTTPMLVGATQVLTAMPRDAGGATLSGRTVNWVSSNTAVLTVSAPSSVSTPSGATVTLTAVGQGTATITATSESAPGATTPVITVNPVPVASVTVAPTSASIVVGATQQLTATPRDASNNPLSGRAITWTSGTPAVATVDASGLVTAVSVGGPVTITATSEGRSGTSSITVTAVPPPPVATVALSSPVTPMVVGETQVLTAMPRDDGGATLSGRTVNWVSSNTSVLTVSAASSVSTASGATITVTAAGVGTATISAQSEAAPATTTPVITVNPVPPPPVNTVSVSPASASLEVGGTQQLTATLRDVAGNLLTGRTIVWTSATPGVASVDANGLVTGAVAGGPVTITATSEGRSGTSSITVNPVAVASVTLSGPATPMIIGATQVLTASPKDAGGTTLGGRTVTWVSSDPSVLTLSVSSSVSTATGATVTVTAAGAGTATITATSEAAPSVTTPLITVNPVPVVTVTVTPGSASIVVGATQQLSAETRDAGGNILTGRTVTWTSANTGLATVDAGGLVTGVAAGGPVSITATSEGQTGTSSITVNPVPVASVTLSTATTPMVVGGTQQLSAVTRDANDNVLTGRPVTWTSSSNAVLTVSTSGLVTAAGVGTATISATSESVSATTPTITVNPAPPPPVNTVTVSPTSATLAIGGTQQLTAVLRDAANNVLIGRTIIWSSSNTAVATVNSSGLVTAAGAGGPITITATSEGRTGTSSITVSGSLTIRANPFITSGLSSPTFLTQPLNDGRIFVVQQGGMIRVVRDGVLQATPFLDITSRVLSGGERGLLSVAFHPQYASNHYFYVYYTAQTTGEIRIERYTATSADVASPATSKLIFSTPHPNNDHNGGLVTFGPDGMLYAAFGDGGGGSPDQDGNGQNFNAYLAGMIRIDIDNGDPYLIPADNPFVGQANRRPELWAKGFRNPWRYAFDPASSMLYIADVGEALHEEVDVVGTAQRGLNYGWSIMEGVSCFNPSSGCNQTGLTLPIFDYGHTGGACSITGGYVYRGSAMPSVQGHYFYSDFCAGWVHSFRYQGGSALDQRDWGITLSSVNSFGQDFAGELYLVSGSSIYKLVPGP